VEPHAGGPPPPPPPSRRPKARRESHSASTGSHRPRTPRRQSPPSPTLSFSTAATARTCPHTGGGVGESLGRLRLSVQPRARARAADVGAARAHSLGVRDVRHVEEGGAPAPRVRHQRFRAPALGLQPGRNKRAGGSRCEVGLSVNLVDKRRSIRVGMPIDNRYRPFAQRSVDVGMVLIYVFNRGGTLPIPHNERGT